MAEQVSPFALTTLQRVKDLLFDPNLTFAVIGTTALNSVVVSSATIPAQKTIRIGQVITGPGIAAGTTVAAFTSNSIQLSQNATANGTGVTLTIIDQPSAYDTVLTRLINSVSDYIANECGRTSFVQQSYVNDTYSISNPSQKYLLLRNTPVFPAADGIHITSFQWRAGTPSNPSWTDFIPDQYELVNPRTDPISGIVWYPSGEIRVYGVLPGMYNNMIRASYVGGYPVDWPNAGNGNSHRLPADLTGLCENLVIRRFKRRALAGQSSEALAGATQSWRNELDAEDLDVLGQYRQLNF